MDFLSEKHINYDPNQKVNYQRILFAKNLYGKKVKMDNWDVARQAEPKDNDPYNPPGGNNFLSTYRYLGSETPRTGTSETQDMLAQCSMRIDQYYPHRAMVSYPTYGRCEGTSNLPRLPDDYGMTDYRTTTELDYRPYNDVHKPTMQAQIASTPFPLYRRVLSELQDGSSIRRKGINTFQDDGLQQFYTNQHLRSGWHSSYNPATGKFTQGDIPRTNAR